MRDDDYCLSCSFSQIEEQFVDLSFCRTVEIACRLIRKQDGRRIDQRACYRNALLLAAGEFGGLVVQTVLKTYFAEKILRGGRGFPAALSRDESGYHNILLCCKLGKEMMGLEYESDAAPAEGGELVAVKGEDVLPINEKLSAVGSGERSENLEKRGLSGAGCAYDGDDFALTNAYINAFQHLEGAERLMNICCFDNHELLVDGCDAGEFLAFEGLEHGAAAC